MSNKTGLRSAKSAQSKTFQVKPVYAAEIAAIVLEELSHDYGDCCNYLEAAALVRSGSPFLAYLHRATEYEPRRCIGSRVLGASPSTSCCKETD